MAGAAVVLAAVAAGTGGSTGDPEAAPAVAVRADAAPSGAAPSTDAPAAVAAPGVAPLDVPARDLLPVPPSGEPAPVMERSTPARLRIPALGVDSDLMELGLLQDGTMQVPPAGFPAGWYTGAPTPGELGPAVIAGHVDWAGEPGVFSDLLDLSPGDEVTVEREDGTAGVFRVARVEQFPKDQFPTDVVYGDIDHAGLRLITCGGSFDRRAGHYRDNVVVFADLVRPTSDLPRQAASRG